MHHRRDDRQFKNPFIDIIKTSVTNPCTEKSTETFPKNLEEFGKNWDAEKEILKNERYKLVTLEEELKGREEEKIIGNNGHYRKGIEEFELAQFLISKVRIW